MFLAELTWEEGEAAKVEDEDDDEPGYPGAVYSGRGVAAAHEFPFGVVAGVDLIHGETDREKADESVEVVLWRAFALARTG